MALQNKLFTSNIIPENNHVSKVRANREYLLSDDVAYELNTYLNFGPFKTFNDVFDTKYTDNYKNIAGEIGTPGVRSIFNKTGAVLVGTSEKKLPTKEDILNHPSEFRITNNVPLMDSPTAREQIRANSGCSIKELVKASEAGMLGRAIYSYSDFMFCKHLGKMPNNYLITLRRFPLPVGDFINAMGVGGNRKKAGRNLFGQQIGAMVTWLGVSGNEINNILKYSVKMPFKEEKAKWNDVEGTDADSGGGPAAALAAAFDPKYREQMSAGYGGKVVTEYMSKFFNVTTGPYDASKDATWTDDNKVYGPIDRVKSTYMRSEEGIMFAQTFSLVFEYELRSYNGINPRQAMLDLISNILNVTYTTGDFWGGGYKGGGMHQNSLYSNMKVFKAKGGTSNFLDAFMQDCFTMKQQAKGFDFSLKGAMNFLNQLGGMLLGGALNKLGRPQKVYAASLLSEQPVGLWHITIGNPYHPIMSMGNMILTNTTIEHSGPLGLDDFPTQLKVTCEFERGKPRDIREIEKMYMLGNDRIYHGMGKKVFDMYKASQDYQSNSSKTYKQYDSFAVDGETATGDKVEVSTGKNGVKIQEVTGMSEGDLKSMGGILQKYFGETDTYSIYVAATEQEYGSQKRKRKDDTTYKKADGQ